MEMVDRPTSFAKYNTGLNSGLNVSTSALHRLRNIMAKS